MAAHQQALFFLFLVLFFAVQLQSAEVNSRSGKFCRCLPSQPCWPDSATWEAFNRSIGGALIASRPPASPCHDPEFDQAACELAKQKWNDVWWRADQPGALQSPFNEMSGEESCLIGGDRSAPCSQGSVPVFTVRVGSADHVQKTVAFADKHNLRLVIKNTGHEFTGKNTAKGSISLWMHHLKDIAFIDSFKPAGSSWWWFAQSRQSAVKVGAGVQWEELYKAAFDHQKTVVGAQCTSVGAAGGYFQGGGHSQISPSFGLAADNVLEMELVTAAGRLVVANAHQNQDLFWAMRGGGGGTFGVVISVTYATYPALSNLVSASYSFSSNSSTTFKSFLSRFILLNPVLSDFGWGGSYLVTPNSVSISLLLPNKNLEFGQRTFKPILSMAASFPGLAISSSSGMQTFKSYYEWHQATQCPGNKCGFPSGYSLAESSRLIPRRTLHSNPSQLADSLLQFCQAGYSRVSAYLVGGGRVSFPQPNAVNPAWRESLLHVLVVGSVPDASSARKTTANQLTKTSTNLLRDLTPGSGCYMNEADMNEPDWQQAFYGRNYWALKSIKNKVDPKGLFLCRHCVGSEDWSEDLTCRL